MLTRILLYTFLILALAIGMASAAVFVVDDDGNPATTYPNLTTALATAAANPAGPHQIQVRPGAYHDYSISVPANVDEIVGDDAATVIFTPPTAQKKIANLFNLNADYTNGLLIKKLTVKNYYDGVAGGASLDQVVLTEMVFEDNGRCGVLFNSSNNPVGNAVDHSLMFGNDSYGVYIYQAGKVTVEYNTIHDDAVYGVYVTGAPATNYIRNNCFYNHPGVEGFDDNTIYHWTGNFFDDYSGSGYYSLDGGTGIVDLAPNTFTNTATSSSSSWEVFSTHTVDFDWGMANCNPQENGLAAYSFTVSWDITKLQYQAGSASYDKGLLGDGGLYTPPIDSSSVGKLIFAAANYTNPGFGNGRLAYAAFKPLVTGGATITISSQYLDMNNAPLPTVDVPLPLTLTDTQKPVVTNLTPNDPVGDDTYSDPDGAPVQLKVLVSATDNYQLTSLWYRFDGAGSWLYLGPASGTSYTTPAEIYVDITGLSETDHTLNVIASDGVQLSDPVDYPFTIDRTGPAFTGLTMSDPNCPVDPNYTNERLVNVALAGVTGVPTKIQFRVGVSWETVLAYPQTTYNLPDADANYTLRARLIDAYGNIGAAQNDAIELDRSAPVPTGWVLAGGAAKTNTKNITGAVISYGGNGAATLNFSENAGDLVCGNTGWVALTNPVNITLSDDDETKTVYYATRDLAGNVSAILSDDIILDMTPATITSTVVTDASDGEEDCSDNWTVDVTVSYPEADVVWLGLSTTSGSGYTWYNISAATSPVTESYTIAGGSCDAVNTIYSVLIDDINNYSAEGSDGILVDCAVPTAGTMALDNGATFSPDVTVDVTLTGMSSDIVEVIMSPISGDYSGSTWVPFDPLNPTVAYTFSSPAENAWVPLYLKARDCAGRESGEVSDAIIFDLTAPVINTMVINLGAIKTNSPTVTVTYTWTEVYPYQIMLAENSAFTGASWQSHGTSVTFTFNPPTDAAKTIYMKMKDNAGHESAVISDGITLDQAPPTGSFTILSGNPSAASGYTNNLANNSLVNITYSGDAVSMRFKNSGGVYTTWMPVAGTYPSPWTLAGPAGVNTVQVQFRDDALNTGGPYDATIIYDVTAPAATPSAGGIPGGSLHLGWTAVPGAYKYIIRYAFWNDYPLYGGAVPPHPLTMSEGLSAGTVTAPQVDYMGFGLGTYPADIYAISIWTMDSAGNYSGPNIDVLETNYILGDFDFDGSVEFADEFGAFAGAYYRCFPQDGFDPVIDIGPTDDGSGTGYPTPDGCIDFEDLIPFAMNYDAYGAPKGNNPGPSKIAPVTIMAQLPDQMTAGSEYTISISNDNPSIIKGFHLVFNYDRDNLEIVNVKQGKMFETSNQTFFFNKAEGKEFLIDGVIFGAGAQFKEAEIAQVTIRAIHSITSVELKEMVLTVRDVNNKDVPTSFSTTVVKGVTPAIPTVFALSQNYPNPFNPTTTIELSLPVASEYVLDIYNVVGQKIKSFAGFSEAGIVTINWDAGNAASGVYFYKVKAGDFTATKKMMLVK
ncbi:exported hypothetical protein [Candidatus Zixiibacteriota bacterium]|nr:exported hypothetical protein [candidate division Zixibacteria bacterium]